MGATLVSVAAANDYDLIVEGLAAMLGRFPDRLEVRDRILIGEPLAVPVDVVLYDTYGRRGIAADSLRALRADPRVGHIALFSLDLPEEVRAEALEAGVTGFISKALPAEQVADAVVALAADGWVDAWPVGHQGRAAGAAHEDGHEQGDGCAQEGEAEVDVDVDVEVGVPAEVDVPAEVGVPVEGGVAVEVGWPGREDGLTYRESEVLVLVAEGLSSSEVAAALFVGVETVKSHLRSVYAKLGLRNRVDAVSYVHRLGGFRRRPEGPSAALAQPGEPPESS